MHASTEQLLTLRDGGRLDDRLVAHVATCADCTDKLQATNEIRDALRALGPVEPPVDGWSQIAHRLADAGTAGSWRRVAMAVGVAASAAVAALLLLRMPAQQPDGVTVSTADTDALPVVSRPAGPSPLLAESQRLEALIDDYRRRQPVPSDPGLAFAVQGLEDQVALVDYGLTYAAEVDLDNEQFDQLWRQRVDLMNSIAQVRAAELRRVEYFDGLR